MAFLWNIRHKVIAVLLYIREPWRMLSQHDSLIAWTFKYIIFLGRRRELMEQLKGHVLAGEGSIFKAELWLIALVS